MWAYWCAALLGGIAIGGGVAWRRRAGWRAPQFVKLTAQRYSDLRGDRSQS